MKTYKRLLSGMTAALLLAVSLTGCKDYKIPEANASLSYPVGEIAAGATEYLSAQPSVRTSSTPTFKITNVVCSIPNDLSLPRIAINTATGMILFEWPDGRAATTCIYDVSVQMTNAEGTIEFPNAFKLVVKGLDFEKGVTVKGQAKTFEVRDIYLAQNQGSVFKLVPPANDVNDDYKHFSIDTTTCAVTVDAEMDAGVYPVSIKVTNRTNPSGTIFENVLSVTVESKPYNLKYTPNSVTLMLKEGHTSPTPTVRAASDADGAQVTYSLLDDFGGAFAVNASTGVITLPKGQILADQTPKTYALQVRAANSLGSTSFPDAYLVTVDPTKKAEPITAITYPDVFPVALKPGQAWTSGIPVQTGSALDLVYSLVDAPEGVTIDPTTGVITMTENHRMPLKEANNKLTLQAINIAMDTPYETKIGDFSIKMPDPLWVAAYHSISSAAAVTDSGIDNMDRYSFSSHIQNNQNTDKGATTPVVRNAFGRAWNTGNTFFDAIDFIGSNASNTWADNTSQNNDWIVSGEVSLPAASASFLLPYIKFELNAQYASENAVKYEVWAVEINSTNVYTKGEQNQDSKGMDAKPSDLPWTVLATIDKNNADIPVKLTSGTTLAGTPVANAVDISQFSGKKIRFALRAWNPADDRANNGRTYRAFNLRVEQDLPKE